MTMNDLILEYEAAEDDLKGDPSSSQATRRSNLAVAAFARAYNFHFPEKKDGRWLKGGALGKYYTMCQTSMGPIMGVAESLEVVDAEAYEVPAK